MTAPDPVNPVDTLPALAATARAAVADLYRELYVVAGATSDERTGHLLRATYARARDCGTLLGVILDDLATARDHAALADSIARHPAGRKL